MMKYTAATFLILSMFFLGCDEDIGIPIISCSNDIQDGYETGVDCGGPHCTPCPLPGHCSDGVQDGDETEIDCGGSCAPCPVQEFFMYCKVDGADWDSPASGFFSAKFDLATKNLIGYSSISGENEISFFFEEDSVAVQTFSIDSLQGNGSADSIYVTLTPSFGSGSYFVGYSGFLDITEYNTTDSVLAGTFEFLSVSNMDPLNGKSVTEGEFRVPIQ